MIFDVEGKVWLNFGCNIGYFKVICILVELYIKIGNRIFRKICLKIVGIVS